MKLIIVSYEEYIIFGRASVNSSTAVGGPLPFDKGGNFPATATILLYEIEDHLWLNSPP